MSKVFITVGCKLDWIRNYSEKNINGPIEYVDCLSEKQSQIREKVESVRFSDSNIVICDRNPTVENRRFYYDMLNRKGREINCIFFDVPIEMAFYYTDQIRDANRKRNEESNIYLFFNYFQPPSLDEGFAKIFTVVPSQEKTSFGKNKAVFISLLSLIDIAGDKKTISGVGDYSLFENVKKSIDVMTKNGYKIFLYADSPSLGNKDVRDCLFFAKDIVSQIGFEPKYICSNSKNGVQKGKHRIANPDSINNAAEKHKIDISKSIMVGSMSFEKSLSQLCGFGYYFHKEVFFLANDFVLKQIKERSLASSEKE